MSEQEITPAEQRVLDAIRDCCIGGMHHNALPGHNQWKCPDILAALREYGAEQRANPIYSIRPSLQVEESNER